MQPLELVLFVAVTVLALALIGTIIWPYARRRQRLAAGAPVEARLPAVRSQALVCPACHREYESGLQFCPYDARDLVQANDPSVRAPTPGMACPTCSRSFDAGKKFCAFDGEELVPLTLAMGANQGVARTFPGALGKICPTCSRRYESDATFCGRDGAELVAVN